jgi:hypothetical protein
MRNRECSGVQALSPAARERWSYSAASPSAYQPRVADSSRPQSPATTAEFPGSQDGSPALSEGSSSGEPACDTHSTANAGTRAPAYCVRNSIRWRLENERSLWRSEYRRALPCWLMSMALHMLLVIVLGSLVAPSITRSYLGSVLLLSFAAEREEAPQAETLLTSSGSISEEGGDLGDRTDLYDGKTRQVADQHQAVHEELADIPPQAEPSARDEADLALSVPEQGEVEQQQIRQSRDLSQAPSVAAAARIPPPEALVAGAIGQPPLPTPDSDDQRRFDDEVNRFIQFDIGRLQGEAGNRARRDFERLGPEAIPALVRGLNRSAKIYASCPVVVISNKLGEVMDHNRDPAMLQYVADHLGEGVPKSAPHIARIQALKNQLLGGALGPDNQPLDQAGFSVAPLVKMLGSPQESLRLDAARQVIERVKEIPADQRPDIAWALIRRLSDRNAQVRSAVHAALVTLADGEDFGPDDQGPTSVKQTSAAASQWYAHFDQQRYEAMAAAVLASAKHFEDSRRRSSALRYYRKVIEEYDGTAAADEASERLKALSTFQLR